MEVGSDKHGLYHSLHRSHRQHNSIWVIVDRVTKSTLFLVVKTTNSEEYYLKLYINEIVRFHRVPISIFLDRDPQFNSYLWKSFPKGLSTQVNLSTTFHPQADGLAQRTIQTLEDILRSCVIKFKGSWDDHVPLTEFTHNNRYHSCIKMVPYQTLYRRRCRCSIDWSQVGKTTLIGTDPLHEAGKKYNSLEIE